MKKFSFIFALMTTIIISGNAWAYTTGGTDCNYTSRGYSTFSSSVRNGSNCSWTYEDGKLTITGTGANAQMGEYGRVGDVSTAPWGQLTVKEVVISGLSNVGQLALYQQNDLKKVTIKDATSIGQYAFQGASFESIDIPSGVTSIGVHAFRNNSNLKDVTLPDGLTTIGTDAFYMCPSLKNITLPASLTTIGNEAFKNSGLTSIEIPEGVTSIGTNAFLNSNLTEGSIFCSQSQISSGICTASKFNNIQPGYYTKDKTTGKTDYYSPDGNNGYKLVKSVNSDGTYTTYDADGNVLGKFNADGTDYVSNDPVTSYTVATATERVNEIGGCEDVKCSLKMWFK